MDELIHASQHYFVDESGDPTLFDSKGRCIVGQEGTSRVFILGAARVGNPVGLQADLTFLRMQLTADPYFRGVPSFDVSANKTALYFHAKDDLPEVRREVFRVLRDHSIDVVAAIRRKATVAEFAAQRFRTIRKKITADEIYDSLVEQVLRERLHLAEHSHVWFARRGKKERKDALSRVLERARTEFAAGHREAVLKRLGGKEPKTTIYSAHPSEAAGLQAIDYCLWALQRLLERGEGRYFEYVRDKFRAIWDIDDTRQGPGGICHRGRRGHPIDSKQILPVVS